MHAGHTTLLNENEYFLRLAKGDEMAFEKIFFHYAACIQPFIRKMTHSEEATEEIIQEVFISLWKNREKLGEVDNYGAYVFTMATNKTYTYLKLQTRKERNLNQLARAGKYSTNNTQETIELHETQELVSRLVTKLPPQRKLIYKLTREDGLTHDEIARQLNISKNTVKNHLIETLKFLRENLQRTQGLSLLLIKILIKIYS